MEQGLVNKHASGLHLHLVTPWDLEDQVTLVVYLCTLLSEMHEQ